MSFDIQPDKSIPLSVPEVIQEDIEAVVATMKAGWVAPAGPYLREFEEAFIGFLGGGHAVSLGSGTAAIHLALVVAGVGAGDEVLCSTFTFVATANPILYVGATPVFIDSEERTWNLDPELLREYLHDCRKQGKRLPKALVLAHIYGQPAEMDKILPICEEYGVTLIEDAAEALGARYQERWVGTFGAVAAFSFNGNKVLTTGGGGMLVSSSFSWTERARYLAAQAKDLEPEYHHSEVGYNYRMSSLGAALGTSQLKRLETCVNRKRAVFNSYVQLLREIPEIQPMPSVAGGWESRWLSSFYFDPEKLGVTPEELVAGLAINQIESRLLWLPLHQQPIYRGCRVVNRSVAEKLRKGGISLPSSTVLSQQDIERVVEAVRRVLRR